MNKTTKSKSDFAAMMATVSEIALHHLDLTTLEPRNSDSLDFKEQSVTSVKQALMAAYELGRIAGRDTK